MRHNDGPSIKLVELFELVGAGLILSVAWSFGVQLVVSFCSGISVVLFYHPRNLEMSQYVVSVESSSLIHHSPYSRFIVSYVDSMMGKETFIWPKCIEPLQNLRAKSRIQ